MMTTMLMSLKRMLHLIDGDDDDDDDEDDNVDDDDGDDDGDEDENDGDDDDDDGNDFKADASFEISLSCIPGLQNLKNHRVEKHRCVTTTNNCCTQSIYKSTLSRNIAVPNQMLFFCSILFLFFFPED